MRHSSLLLYFALCSIAAAEPRVIMVDQPNVRIGVIGDIHLNDEALSHAIDQLRSQQINLFFGMGDYTDYGDLEGLGRVLESIAKKLDLPPTKMLLVPGNMEDHFDSYKEYGSIMERYGTVVADHSNTHGFVDLNGKWRFMLSHIAQTRPPQHLLPPPAASL
jgi:predicted phosphodiesterase